MGCSSSLPESIETSNRNNDSGSSFMTSIQAKKGATVSIEKKNFKSVMNRKSTPRVTGEENPRKILSPEGAQKLFEAHKLIESSSNAKTLAANQRQTQIYNSAVSIFKMNLISHSHDVEGGENSTLNIFSTKFAGEKDPNSFNTLDNKQIDSINYSILRMKKYYKNQHPPSECDSSSHFIDNLFPPNKDSVFGLRNGVHVDKIDSRREKAKSSFKFDKDDIIWLRAEEIFVGGKYSIFTDEIEIDDIVQGNLGNCYFLSSLSAMAKLPQLVGQLFKTLTVPSNGCFEVAVRINGKWKIVIIDDYFPCHKKTKIPIFAKPVGAELWVMILEKVWAKINGGYLNTISGSSADVLNCFTSFPMSTLHHKKFPNSCSGDLWNLIKSSFQNGHIMTCDSNDDAEIERFGLISGHSFTITSLRDAEFNSNRVRILQLRNPWGHKEWTGAWSDNSAEWTEDTIKSLKVNLEQKDDGKFWISFEDFIKFFSVTNVCRVYSPQCCKHISVKKANAHLPHIFELHLNHTNQLVVSAIKKSWRFDRKLPSDLELHINIVIARKINKEVIQYVTSTHDNEHNAVLECTLTKGTYLVYIHANYQSSLHDHQMKYFVYFTSNRYFDFIPIGTDNENFDILRHVFISKIEEDYLKSEEDFIYTANKFEMTTYGCLYIANKTSDEYEITAKDESENFLLLGKLFEGNKSKLVKFCLKPNERIVILGMRKEYHERFIFKIKVDSNKLIENESLSKATIEPLSLRSEIKPDFFDESKYDFFFKKMDFDMASIVEKIDFKKLTENYFVNKYPDVSTIIDKVPLLNDGEEVIFRDIFDVNDHCCYLGEWKVKMDVIRHGRGMCIWSDGSYYMGQFRNDNSEGFGIHQYPSGDRVEINWVNGKMNGKGRYFRVNGNSYDIEYDHEKLVEHK